MICSKGAAAICVYANLGLGHAMFMRDLMSAWFRLLVLPCANGFYIAHAF